MTGPSNGERIWSTVRVYKGCVVRELQLDCDDGRGDSLGIFTWGDTLTDAARSIATCLGGDMEPVHLGREQCAEFVEQFEALHWIFCRLRANAAARADVDDIEHLEVAHRLALSMASLIDTVEDAEPTQGDPVKAES